MADLLAIYQELGLPGLVPHALRDGSRGRQMLISKIKAGDPLFLIGTSLNAPFVLVKDDTYQAYVFASMEDAQAKCNELAAKRYNVHVEEFPGGEDREDAFLWLFDHGPTHVFINEAISIPISRFASVPTYDGQPNEEHMLRNRVLCGAILHYLQTACAQMSNMEAENLWARLMYHGTFLLAVQDDRANNYPILTDDIRGRPCALVYTDWRQIRMDFEEPPAGLLCRFEDMEEFLLANPGSGILLNRATCHILLTVELLTIIKQLTISPASGGPAARSALASKPTVQTFGQVGEDDWDKVDPTPDFLK